MPHASAQRMVQRGERLCLICVKLGKTLLALKECFRVCFVILLCNHSKGAKQAGLYIGTEDLQLDRHRSARLEDLERVASRAVEL